LGEFDLNARPFAQEVSSIATARSLQWQV